MFVPVLAGFSNSSINCHSKCHRSHTWPPFLSFFKHKSWSRKSWRLNGSTMVIMVLCHYADGAWWCLGWTSQPPSPSPQWAARNLGRDAVAKMLPAMADCSNIFRGIKNHENGEVHHVSLQQFFSHCANDPNEAEPKVISHRFVRFVKSSEIICRAFAPKAEMTAFSDRTGSNWRSRTLSPEMVQTSPKAKAKGLSRNKLES